MARRRARAGGPRKRKAGFVLRGYHVVCQIKKITHRRK